MDLPLDTVDCYLMDTICNCVRDSFAPREPLGLELHAVATETTTTKAKDAARRISICGDPFIHPAGLLFGRS